LVARWGCGVKGERPCPRLAEDTVDDEGVHVDVELETAAEAPDTLGQSALPRPSRARRSPRERTCARAGRWRRSGCPFIRSTASRSRSSLATAATRYG